MGPLSLNTATVKKQWTLAQAIDGCARHGIRGIAPWRDQVEQMGLSKAKNAIQENNLVVTGLCRGGFFTAKGDYQEQMDKVLALFPRLKERYAQRAGTMSGGEQQMLVIGRALMSTPRVMLLDEPSLGLAPMLVEEIFQIVKRLNEEQKLTVLLVEQNATLALAIAEHGYVMENGRIVLEGAAAALRDNADIKEFYLGLTEVGARKSYRDVKHYKRRKRWLS